MAGEAASWLTARGEIPLELQAAMAFGGATFAIVLFAGDRVSLFAEHNAAAAVGAERGLNFGGFRNFSKLYSLVPYQTYISVSILLRHS